MLKIRFPKWPLQIIFLVTLIINLAIAQEGIKMDIRTDIAELHNRVIYSVDSFNNIPQMLQKKEALISGTETERLYTHLCARGNWLLYQNPHFVTEDNSLSGIKLLTTSKQECFSLDPNEDIGPLGSAQPLTGQHFKEPHITFFPEANFMGVAMPVSTPNKEFQTKPADQPPTATQIVNSLMTVGAYRWTLTLNDDTKICVQPKRSPTALCFLSNLVDNVKIFPATTLQRVRRHCLVNETKFTLVELTECYEIGQGIVTPLKPAWPFDPPSTDTTNSGGGGDSCKIDDSKDVLTPEQKELIQGRLNGTIGTGDLMQAITNPKNIWKTELFDKTAKIFMSICNSEVVDREYLFLFAALYFHHLDKVWENETLANNNEEELFSEAAWMEINHDLNTCFEVAATPAFGAIAKGVVQSFMLYRDWKEITSEIDESLGRRPDYDHIMEINWIMANAVASICQKIRKDVNFAPRYWNVYHPLYFTPIIKQWVNPEDFAIAYKYIFGGYGMEKTLAKIALCAHRTMLSAHTQEPYKRPMEHNQDILQPSSFTI